MTADAITLEQWLLVDHVLSRDLTLGSSKDHTCGVIKLNDDSHSVWWQFSRVLVPIQLSPSHK